MNYLKALAAIKIASEEYGFDVLASLAAHGITPAPEDTIREDGSIELRISVDIFSEYLNEEDIPQSACDWLDAIVEERDDCYTIGEMEFWVLNTDEATKAFNSAIDDYIDEIISPMNESYHRYFDRARCFHSIEANTDYGTQLAWYDGVEHEYGRYYIYRTH